MNSNTVVWKWLRYEKWGDQSWNSYHLACFKIQFEHVPRRANSVAHKLSKIARYSALPRRWAFPDDSKLVPFQLTSPLFIEVSELRVILPRVPLFPLVYVSYTCMTFCKWRSIQTSYLYVTRTCE
jgi:hypothetical protein